MKRIIFRVYILYAFHMLLLSNMNHIKKRSKHINQGTYVLVWGFFVVKFREKSYTNLTLSLFYFHKLKKHWFTTVIVKLLNGLFQNFWYFWSVTWYRLVASKTGCQSKSCLRCSWKRKKQTKYRPSCKTASAFVFSYLEVREKVQWARTFPAF